MANAEQLKQLAENWRRVAARQEELRIEAIRNSDVAASIAAFDTAFRSAIWLSPPSPTSGLVEWQKLLARMYKR